MFAKRVEQNRQLLYKFPLRDDRRHGGASYGRAVYDPILQAVNRFKHY